MKLDWVLDMLLRGCDVYRLARPDFVYRFVDSEIICARPGGRNIECRLRSGDVLANDWVYRCPGHKWQYHPDYDIRQCSICEKEESGDFLAEKSAYSASLDIERAKTAKALPMPGDTCHPGEETCCERWPKCDCHSESLGWWLGFYNLDGSLTADGIRHMKDYGRVS